eukprot:scaffold2043_cov166-Amphora_coffeaeformis.AAC.32
MTRTRDKKDGRVGRYNHDHSLPGTSPATPIQHPRNSTVEIWNYYHLRSGPANHLMDPTNDSSTCTSQNSPSSSDDPSVATPTTTSSSTTNSQPLPRTPRQPRPTVGLHSTT